MECQLNLLSKYRTELMGFGAICVILCHSVGRGVLMPGILAQILSYGNIGVDFFLFLSGLGIYYSLSKREISGLGGWGWYKDRFKKLLIPYTVVIIPIYIIKCFFELTTIKDAILDYTTLSFWTNHRSAWFIALIIPLYLLSPFLYYIVNKAKLVDIVTCSILCILCVIGSLISNSDTPDEIIFNIQFVLKRVPSFLIGFWIAPYVKNRCFIKWTWLSILIILSICIKIVVPYDICPYFLMVLPLLLILAQLLDIKFIIGKAKQLLFFMGNISLESYLTNVALPSVIALLPLRTDYLDLSYGNYFFYGLIVFLGLMLSVVFNQVTKGLLNILNKKDNKIQKNE